jgi:uncharacterized membrane protein
MSPATLLALLAMVGAGIGDFVYKQGARAGIPAHRFLMVQTWTFGPSVLLYGLATSALALDAATLWGAVAGLFAFTGFYNFAKSLHGGMVSINAPIFRLSFVVTVVLALAFLGESPSARTLAGVACALVAVWSLLGAALPAGRRPERAAALASLARVGVATLAVGIMNVVYKLGLGAGATPASLLTAQACVVASLALGLVKLADGAVRVPPSAWRYAGSAGVVLALAFIGLTEALARGQASVVVPIAQMGFVVTAVLGVVVLREPFGRRTAVGLAAAAGAIALLAPG